MEETGLRTCQQQERMREWIRQVESCRNSGLSVGEWCEQNGVSPYTYYKRQTKVFKYLKAGKESEFAEITVNRTVSGIAGTEPERIRARIRSSRYEIEIYDPEVLVQVLERC